MGRVLLVDRDAPVRRAWARALLEARLDVLTAEGAAAARALLAPPPDVIVASLADADELCAELESPPPVVAVVDRAAPPDARLERAFAAVERAELPPVGLALLVGSALRGPALASSSAAEPLPFATVSPAGRTALRAALKASPSPAPLLIIGEPGAGRRTLARAVHARSPRRGEVHEVDVGALDPGALGSTLGGIKNDATVILVDVGELDAAGQTALARWLAGAAEGPRPVATATPAIRDAVAAGRFARDLFYRLSPAVIDLPPLRARTDDIGLLAHVFLERATTRFGLTPRRFSREALRALKAWPFPDNAVELEAVVVRAATSSSEPTIRPGDLGLPAPRSSVAPAAAEGDVLFYTVERERAVRAFEKAYAERVLSHAGGNVSQAARLAGMDPANMRRLLRRVRGGRPIGKGRGKAKGS